MGRALQPWEDFMGRFLPRIHEGLEHEWSSVWLQKGGKVHLTGPDLNEEPSALQLEADSKTLNRTSTLVFRK